MERKTTSLTMVILLILPLLVVSIPQLMGVRTVEASKAAILYTPNFHYGGEPAGEETYSSQVANMIMWYLNYYGSGYYYLYNCQNEYVTRSRVGRLAEYCETNFDMTEVYFKGHDVPWGCGRHYKLLDHYGTGIEDNYMYYKTVRGEHDFVFLWACGTSQEYPGSYCGQCQAYRGHCYCWTHDNSLSLDGYYWPDSGTEVFLGFWWWSPYFKNPTYHADYNFGDFAVYFYKYRVQDDQSVKNALNLASLLTLGTSFGTSRLRSDEFYLDVYGNGNLKFP